MSDGTGRGFLMSAMLHGIVAALMFYAFVLKHEDSELPKVFELVAGEGDNYMAREAPALGTPGGVKLEVPKIPESKPVPREPVQEFTPAPTPPPTPTPKQVTPTPQKQQPPDPTAPNFKKDIKRAVINAESKAKKEIKKERDAAEKAEKKAEEEKKRLSKEEFDRMNKGKTSSTPTKVASNTKAPKIDAEGIAKGVVGGSTNNKVGGAGGKALTNDNDDALLGYFTKFKLELRKEFEPPPGLSDSLQVTIEVRSNADGTFTSGRVVRTSGSAEFDRAVLDAIKRVRPFAPRPDKKSEFVEFVFTMRERNER